MRKLRIDLYSGYRDDKSFTEHDTFCQLDKEPIEDFVARITEALFENVEQLTYEDESNEDDWS